MSILHSGKEPLEDKYFWHPRWHPLTSFDLKRPNLYSKICSRGAGSLWVDCIPILAGTLKPRQQVTRGPKPTAIKFGKKTHLWREEDFQGLTATPTSKLQHDLCVELFSNCWRYVLSQLLFYFKHKNTLWDTSLASFQACASATWIISCSIPTRCNASRVVNSMPKPHSWASRRQFSANTISGTCGKSSWASNLQKKKEKQRTIYLHRLSVVKF